MPIRAARRKGDVSTSARMMKNDVFEVKFIS
jgi:hypothetical protein